MAVHSSRKTPTESPDSCRRQPWRVILLAGALGALLVAGFVPAARNSIADLLGELLEWTQGLGVWGPVAVAAFYVVACVFALPGSVLTLGAGLLFGVVKGTITVSIGSTLGACAAFIVGRSLARKWVEQKVSARGKFAAIDEAVGRQGFKVVLLTRLSPIFPFNLLNYGYGLTKVPFWKYALASWIGMLPGTVMYVYLGSATGSLAKIVGGEAKGGTAQQVFFWSGLAFAIVVAIVITRIARKALAQTVAGLDKHTRQLPGQNSASIVQTAGIQKGKGRI